MARAAANVVNKVAKKVNRAAKTPAAQDVESGVVKLAGQIGYFVGTVQHKADGWLESETLFTEPPQELEAAVRSGEPRGKVLADVFGNPINMQHWNDNNPFVLARKNQAEIAGLKIYFNCGEDDNFGFEKGAAALHAQLKKESIKHEYHLYPGDHSVDYFLEHFPEVMEFHTRAFGLK